ncbi:hypothetical protein MDA_GLEAN10021524 [Myotis davidii]|uniref:Myb/SANT-like DNA-binding domain-containing protein 3 n=1 Tax=Myotis davidii TaxID=225400 RepID=L5M7B5_MYODS|nr:hypothetical protein MDA_GLEAN10021524 [Myotis davidii]
MQNNEIIKPAKYFSELEKSILLALVEKYKYVLECKKSDARTIALKQRTWQALAHEYNSQPSVSLRDFKQLKKCWENIKARTKKIMAHERREKVKRSVSPLLSSHVLGKEKIASMLPEQLYFLQSPPEEEPEYHPDAAAQGRTSSSSRDEGSLENCSPEICLPRPHLDLELQETPCSSQSFSYECQSEANLELNVRESDVRVCDESSCKYGGVCKEDGDGLKCACQFQCHTNYIPVCASNGDTYQNECFLRRAACKHQKEITVVARGPCYSDNGSGSGEGDTDDTSLLGKKDDGLPYRPDVKDASDQREDVYIGNHMPCPENLNGYCIHGKCEFIYATQKASCRCESGYTGQHCEKTDFSILYVVPIYTHLLPSQTLGHHSIFLTVLYRIFTTHSAPLPLVACHVPCHSLVVIASD